MHIFIEGRNGMGLAELVTRLADRAAEETRFREPFGFHTRYLLEPGTQRKLVYIHRWGDYEPAAEEWLVGTCLKGRPETRPEAFERFAPLLEQIPAGSFSVFNELGIMETKAASFVSAVEKVLDQPGVVLAAIRDIDRPFLNRLRERKDVQLFSAIESDNLAILEEEAFQALKEQLESL